MKNAIVVYAMSAYGIVLSVEVALPELLEEPHYMQSTTFIRDLLARRNLCTAASRASGLAAKWYWLHYDEAQGLIFCFCGIPMHTLHDLI